MMHSDSLANLGAALAAAQGEIENALKTSTNPHFRSKYADLAEIINTSRPVLSKHGLSVVQVPGFADGVVTLDSMLLHKSGEWIMATSGAPIGKADAQGVGSATTYLRRYSLAAICGIAQEDDDGNAATASTKQEDRGRGNGQGGNRQTTSRAPKADGGGVPWDKVMPFGKTKGKPLHEHTDTQLDATLAWCIEKDAEKFADLIAAIEATLEHRGVAA